MATEVEKVYCVDPSNGNSDALAYLAGQNKGTDPMAMAAMMNNGGMGNWMNNPFAYMMFMSLFNNGNWGGGFGGNGAAGALMGANTALNGVQQASIDALSTQLQGLAGQMQDNHNTDQLNSNINRTQSQLGDMNTSMVGGFANLAQDINGVQSAVQAVGCGIRNAVTEQGYQNQLANCQQTNTILQQSQALQNTVQTGITSLGFQIERNACDVKETSTANTQKIVDTLNNHWNLEQQTTIQQLRDEVGRLTQTNQLIAALKTTATT